MTKSIQEISIIDDNFYISLTVCPANKGGVIVKSDLEIAQEAKLKPIIEIAKSIGLDEDDIELYGKLEKWAKRENIECYRMYDADLPEYNVAIDRYGDYVIIQGIAYNVIYLLIRTLRNSALS